MDAGKPPRCPPDPGRRRGGTTGAKSARPGVEAAAAYLRLGTGRFVGNGKAIALGQAEGFIKTVFDEATGELLGAHMIGAEVAELTQASHRAYLETTEQELMKTAFPHPTLSEMLHESVLTAYGLPLHI